MTWQQRQQYLANNVTRKRLAGVAKAWDDAQRAISHDIDHPWEAMQSMGSWVKHTVESGWNDLRDVYGEGFQVANVISELAEANCTNYWQMVVETAIPAAGSALWLLVVPSPTQILQEYLTPKHIRSGHRGPGLIRRVTRKATEAGRISRSWPEIPDTEKLIANYIPGHSALEGRDIGNGQRWLFRSLKSWDLVGWYWLLVDAGKDFEAHWMSGIIHSAAGQNCGDYLLDAQFYNPSNPEQAWNGAWYSHTTTTITETVGTQVADAGTLNLIGVDTTRNIRVAGGAVCSFKNTYTGTGAGSAITVQARVAWTDLHGSVHYDDQDTVTIDAGQSLDLGWYFRHLPAQSIQMVWTTTAGPPDPDQYIEQYSGQVSLVGVYE